MYLYKFFPFISDSDFIRNVEKSVSFGSIYCPIHFDGTPSTSNALGAKENRVFKAYHVLPCDVIVLMSMKVLLRILFLVFMVLLFVLILLR